MSGDTSELSKRAANNGSGRSPIKKANAPGRHTGAFNVWFETVRQEPIDVGFMWMFETVRQEPMDVGVVWMLTKAA